MPTSTLSSLQPAVLAGMSSFSVPFWPAEFTAALPEDAKHLVGWIYFKDDRLFGRDVFERLTDLKNIYPEVIQVRSSRLPNLSQTEASAFTGSIKAQVEKFLNISASANKSLDVLINVENPVLIELKDRADFYSALVALEKQDGKILKKLEDIIVHKFGGKTKGLIYVDKCLQVSSLSISIVNKSGAALSLDAAKLGDLLQMPQLKVEGSGSATQKLSADKPVFLAYDYDQVGNLISTTGLSKALVQKNVKGELVRA